MLPLSNSDSKLTVRLPLIPSSTSSLISQLPWVNSFLYSLQLPWDTFIPCSPELDCTLMQPDFFSSPSFVTLELFVQWLPFWSTSMSSRTIFISLTIVNRKEGPRVIWLNLGRTERKFFLCYINKKEYQKAKTELKIKYLVSPPCVSGPGLWLLWIAKTNKS